MTDFVVKFTRYDSKKAERRISGPTFLYADDFSKACQVAYFRCPACGRVGRFNTNYLGRHRVVTCNGRIFERRPLDLQLAVAEHDAKDGTNDTTK